MSHLLLCPLSGPRQAHGSAAWCISVTSRSYSTQVSSIWSARRLLPTKRHCIAGCQSFCLRDFGPWTLDFGPWTLDFRLWTVARGPRSALRHPITPTLHHSVNPLIHPSTNPPPPPRSPLSLFTADCSPTLDFGLWTLDFSRSWKVVEGPGRSWKVRQTGSPRSAGFFPSRDKQRMNR